MGGQKPLLSVVISSYNRKDLLIRNLKIMLECKTESLVFIVCDNGSSDNTWESLTQIDDPRVIKKRNFRNYGFDNFWLMSFDANTEYFMFLNDRDYIPCPDLEAICERLKQIEPVDFISCDRGTYEIGYYSWEDAVKLYFQSRHPGTLIYNTAFCQRVLKKEIIERYLEEARPQYANNYLVFQILLRVQRVYAHSAFLIVQPDNREAIKKEREEYYGCVYLSLEYRIREYYDWLIYAGKIGKSERSKKVLEEIYRDSFKTVTTEYYYSLHIPGFKERNGCENLRAAQWFANGLRFCKEFYCAPLLPYPDMKRFILSTTLAELLKSLKTISREPFKRFKRFCKKELCHIWTT